MTCRPSPCRAPLTPNLRHFIVWQSERSVCGSLQCIFRLTAVHRSKYPAPWCGSSTLVLRITMRHAFNPVTAKECTWVYDTLGLRSAAEKTRGYCVVRGAMLTTSNSQGMLHATIVRSPHAHARLHAIRLEAARALPGVAGVFRFSDLAAWMKPMPSAGLPPPNLKARLNITLRHHTAVSSGARPGTVRWRTGRCGCGA